MSRRDRPDEDVAAQRRGSAFRKLGHVGEAVRSEQRSRPDGNDQTDVATESSKARYVEMIVVRVRDENGIDRDRVENRCLCATPDRPDPALQEGDRTAA